MRACIVLFLLAGCLAGCGSAGLDPGERLYLVRSDLGPSASFRIRLDAPGSIEQAEQLLRPGDPRWVVGRLPRGAGGFNSPWSWPLAPKDPAGITFAEATIEECQAAPRYIEEHLDAWLQRQGLTCL